jgi:hypothetical protein
MGVPGDKENNGGKCGPSSFFLARQVESLSLPREKKMKAPFFQAVSGRFAVS